MGDAEIEGLPAERALGSCGASLAEIVPEAERDGRQLQAGASAAVVDHAFIAIVGGMPCHALFPDCRGHGRSPVSRSRRCPTARGMRPAVDALEAVRAEEIALRLDEVGRAAALAVAVEIGKRRGQRRHRQPGLGGARDDAAQRRMRFLHHVDEGRRHQKIGRGRHSPNAAAMRAEELRADDAAGAPDPGDRRQRQAPAEFLRRRLP